MHVLGRINKLAFNMYTITLYYVFYNFMIENVCIFYTMNRKYFERVIAVYLAVNKNSLFFSYFISVYFDSCSNRVKGLITAVWLASSSNPQFLLASEFSVISIRKVPPDKCSNKLEISFSAFSPARMSLKKLESEKIEIIIKGVTLNHLPSA